MRNRVLKALVPMAGLAVIAMPALVVAPAIAPDNTACAGGICEVCPAVAKVLTATGAQIYCIA